MTPKHPISEGWSTEKLASVVENLARAVAAHRLIEDPDVREVVGRGLHVALYNAMKFASQALADPSLFSPDRMYAIWSAPDLVCAWLEDAGCPRPAHDTEAIGESAARQLSDLRRWRSGERPRHWTDDGSDS